MSKQKKTPHVRTMTPKLIHINCPPAIFDVEGAAIERRKRVAIWKLDSIKAFKPGQEEQMAEMYADLIPHWFGVVDVDTGEILPDLKDEPMGLFKLDMEQIQWLTQILQTPASKIGSDPNPTNGRTR